jgi:tetratricopeptide (TPR) repeat protein
MKLKLKQILALIGLFALLSGSLLAQSGEQTSERQALDKALAVEEASARITALQSFLAAHSESSLAETAKENIVTSWAILAEGQLAARNIDRALHYFHQALAALPKQISDNFFEETVARIPLAVSARGYRAEAVGLARELEPGFSKEPQRLGALGEFYLSIEAAGDAIRALELAAQLAPDEARVHRALGAAYRQGLRLDDAAAEYQRAIGIDAREKQSYYELANLYRAQGAYEDAVKLYHRQLELEPRHTPSLKGLALTYLALGKEDLATKELNKVRDSKDAAEDLTRDVYLQTQLAFYYLAQGKITQARKAAEVALVIEPRYSWARIAAAEVDLAQDHYFEAERHLLTALNYANFPTLYFTLGRVYLAVEDFDGALDQFAKAFSCTPAGFATKLGGVFDARAEGLAELLSRERQASLFVYEPPAFEAQFKLSETLVRWDAHLRGPWPSSSNGSKRSGNQPDSRTTESPSKVEGLEKAAMEFIEADSTRRPFRSLYVAQRLTRSGQALALAAKLAQQALDLAESATELNGSVRDYPNYDREGRWRMFRGRAADAQGWALFKLERNDEAMTALTEAVTAYGDLPEGKRALWHLAVVKETAGELREALNLYLAGYEAPSPPSQGSNLNRTVIEVLYRKIYGSLKGLDERLGKPVGAASPSAASPSMTEITKAAPPKEQPSNPKVSTPPTDTTPPDPTVSSEIKLPVIDQGKYSSLLLLKPNTALPKLDALSPWLIEALTDPKSIEPPPPVNTATSTREPAAAPGSSRPRRVLASTSAKPPTDPPASTRKRRVTEPKSKPLIKR